MTERPDREFGVEQTPDDAFVGTPPAGDENPDDFISNDQSERTSAETGVTYDAEGEPESTPNDELLDEDAPEPGANAESSTGTEA